MAKRSMIEEEQRQRVRVAAIDLEEKLLALKEDPEDPEPDRTASELREVQKIIENLGREPSYTEGLTIDKHRQEFGEVE